MLDSKVSLLDSNFSFFESRLDITFVLMQILCCGLIVRFEKSSAEIIEEIYLFKGSFCLKLHMLQFKIVFLFHVDILIDIFKVFFTCIPDVVI